MPTRPASHTAQRSRSRNPAPRKTSRRLYDSKRWRTLSLLFLQSNPLCASCQALGRTTPAQCVDHIRAHRGDDQLFWDETNWQPLCNECHGLKTSQETRGGRRAAPSLPGLGAARVAVVAGLPGSVRHAACRAWCGGAPGAVCLDVWAIAGGWGAKDGDIRRGYAIVHAELERLARDGFSGSLAVAVADPSAVSRRAWADGLHADVRVVVEPGLEGVGCEDVDPGAWAVEIGRWHRWFVSDFNEINQMRMKIICNMEDGPGHGGS